MKVGLIGRKVGMTRVYDEAGKATPVTVIEAKDNTLLQVKTSDTDGYDAVQIGFDTQKKQRVTKPELGHFEKHGSEPKKVVREFRLKEALAEPSELTLGVDQFEVGQTVDVIGRSKGKGFQGVMRRHNYHGQNMTHGSMMHRRPGAIGGGSTPGRVWKNQPMPGHMGDERVTVQNLKVVQVRSEEGVILLSGAIPGAKGCCVVVRPAKKAVVKKEGK